MAALQGDAGILGPVEFVALIYGRDSAHLNDREALRPLDF
jgi:hypothetical protein